MALYPFFMHDFHCFQTIGLLEGRVSMPLVLFEGKRGKVEFEQSSQLKKKTSSLLFFFQSFSCVSIRFNTGRFGVLGKLRF